MNKLLEEELAAHAPRRWLVHEPIPRGREPGARRLHPELARTRTAKGVDSAVSGQHDRVQVGARGGDDGRGALAS